MEELKSKVLTAEEIVAKHRLRLKHIVENDGIRERNYHCGVIEEDRFEEDLDIYKKGKNKLHFSPRGRKR
ncbi:MAG: hypothetical protein HOL23_01450 [Gammaproteobacteria bacterium]|jgi:hypothetical protein|nr:hypothetical protein [Gammaproteobacteria bacterium]